MNIKQVAQLTPLDRLVYWIKERESIRLKKEAGAPKPWTDDTILQSYRFCNVRRMDDKVSRWLLDNWYQKDHPNIVVAAVLARHINRISTLRAIGFPDTWQPDYVKEVVRGMKDDGDQVFGSAYMIRGVEGIDKIEMVVDRVCQPLVDNPPLVDPSSFRKSVDTLILYWGLSSFLAGQVVADLRWTMKGVWKDKNTWAPIGPGSKRGMNRLHNRPKDQSLSQERFLEELNELIYKLNGVLPVTISKRLEAMDFQNCMCEYDKYSRVLLDEGRPKQLYPGAP